MRLSEFAFVDAIISERKAWVRRSGGDAYQRAPQAIDDDIEVILRRAREEEEKSGDREFSLTYDGFTYRVSVMVSERGKNYVLRKGGSIVPLLDGLPTPLQPALISQLMSPDLKAGLILIVGQQGVGKTTTACSLLKSRVIHYKHYAVTLEEPTELPLEGEYDGGLIFQTRVRKVYGHDSVIAQWNIGIEEAMRFGRPDMLLLGELRNATAASQAIRAASSGMLVIATMHASTIVDAIMQMVSWASEIEGSTIGPSRVGDVIQAVLHQSRTEGPNSIMRTESLFVGQNAAGTGIRSRIRSGQSGQVQQLNSEILSQGNQMRLNNAVNRTERIALPAGG